MADLAPVEGMPAFECFWLPISPKIKHRQLKATIFGERLRLLPRCRNSSDPTDAPLALHACEVYAFAAKYPERFIRNERGEILFWLHRGVMSAPGGFSAPYLTPFMRTPQRNNFQQAPVPLPAPVGAATMPASASVSPSFLPGGTPDSNGLNHSGNHEQLLPTPSVSLETGQPVEHTSNSPSSSTIVETPESPPSPTKDGQAPQSSVSPPESKQSLLLQHLRNRDKNEARSAALVLSAASLRNSALQGHGGTSENEAHPAMLPPLTSIWNSAPQNQGDPSAVGRPTERWGFSEQESKPQPTLAQQQRLELLEGSEPYQAPTHAHPPNIFERWQKDFFEEVRRIRLLGQQIKAARLAAARLNHYRGSAGPPFSPYVPTQKPDPRSLSNWRAPN